MKKLYILFFFTILINTSFASHFIGYDMALVNIKNSNGQSTNQYKFVLNFYRDLTGTSMPTSLNFTIKRKNNHAVVQNITLNKINPATYLTYNENECAPQAAQLRQEFGYFESPIINGNSFSNTAGYYIYHNHSARNIGIKNVEGTSSYYEVVMTMDFPNLYTSATQYNSSPIFNKKALNFFYLGKPATINMQVQDVDGDSLVYSLAKPLDNGSEKPFYEIPFAQGYNLNYNIIDGAPDITINSSTGLIYFLPTQIGIYLIAIKVEEYRKINGVLTKIGEVRREMQIEIVYVVENPPEIENSKSGFNTYLVDTVKLGESVDLTFTARDSPYDSLYMFVIPNKTPGENFFDYNTLDARWGEPGFLIGGGFAEQLIISGMGVVQGQFRFVPKCNQVRNKPYTFKVVVYDKTCPSRFSDTTFVSIFVDIKSNTSPIFISPDTLFGRNNLLKFYAEVGDNVKLSGDSILKTYDADSLQTVTIKMSGLISNGPDFNNYLSFNNIVGTVNSTANFSIILNCKHVRPEPYIVKFIAYDNHCANPDTIELEVQIYVKSKYIPATNICAITIDSANTNYSVYWEKADSNIVKIYGFTFYNHTLNTYDPLYTQPNSGNQYFNIYTSVFPQDYLPIRMKMACYDECGYRTAYSNVNSSIYLKIAQATNNYHQLTWNSLEGAVVESYRIWKRNNMNPFKLIDSVDANILSYVDSNSNSADYKIEVKRRDTCFSLMNNSSEFSIFSNTVSNAFWGINSGKNIQLKVYPNPSNGVLNLELNNSDLTEAALTDIRGQVFLKQNFSEKCCLDVHELPRGIYLLYITSNSGNVVQKIILN